METFTNEIVIKHAWILSSIFFLFKIVQSEESENTYLFILQVINLILIRRFCNYDLNIDKIVPLDDNVYVTKIARLCQKKALEVNHIK